MNSDDLSFDEVKARELLTFFEEICMKNDRKVNGHRPHGLNDRDDFVQESAIKAIASLKKEMPESNEKGYLATVSNNLYRDEIARKRRICFIDPFDCNKWSTDPNDIQKHTNRDIGEDLMLLFQKLTETEWCVFRLLWGNGKDFQCEHCKQWVGMAMDMSPETLNKTISLVLNAMKRRRPTTFSAHDVITSFNWKISNELLAPKELSDFSLESIDRYLTERIGPLPPAREGSGRHKDGVVIQRLYWKALFYSLLSADMGRIKDGNTAATTLSINIARALNRNALLINPITSLALYEYHKKTVNSECIMCVLEARIKISSWFTQIENASEAAGIPEEKAKAMYADVKRSMIFS